MDLKLTNECGKPLDAWSVNKSKSQLKNAKPSISVEKKSMSVEVKSPLMEAMALLDKMPNVRPDKVELGKRLIQDVNYPNKKALDRVASALLGEVDIYGE